MPSNTASRLSALLQSSSLVDDNEVLAAANQSIKADENNLEAHHTKIVALLKLDRFQDAITAISEGSNALQSQCAMEKAYALYKIGEIEDASKTLFNTPSSNVGFKHLAAQVAYRAERFHEASAIYDQMAADETRQSETDLAINITAVRAQETWLGSPQPATADLPNTFELCYNTACSHIARGAYETATQLLQRAAALCKASEDLSDEDKEAELRPIWVQQAFVCAVEGNSKQAIDLYNSLGSTDDADPDFAVVAKNNLVYLSNDTENPYIAQRKMQSVVAAGQGAKLFHHQNNILSRNSYVADMNAYKTSGVEKRTRAQLPSNPAPSADSRSTMLSIVNTTALTKDSKDESLVRILQDLIIKRPHDIGVVLVAIQVQIRQNRLGAACATLLALFARLAKMGDEAAMDARYSPGLIALAVSLLRKQGRHNAAKSEFAKATKHWISRSSNSRSEFVTLLESGVQLMRSSNSDELKLANSAFEILSQNGVSGQVASAGVVASLSAPGTSTTERHASKLPPVSELIRNTDVGALVGAGVVSATGSLAVRKRKVDDSSLVQPKKHRRTKLPKDYVDGQTPDPERWLPLRDRSSYKPKNKRGKKKAADSTQGGVIKDEETLGLVGGGGVKVEKAAGGVAAKKKKKGKK